MAKFTLSELNSVDSIDTDDLVLISRKNDTNQGYTTYSVNASLLGSSNGQTSFSSSSILDYYNSEDAYVDVFLSSGGLNYYNLNMVSAHVKYGSIDQSIGSESNSQTEFLNDLGTSTLYVLYNNDITSENSGEDVVEDNVDIYEQFLLCKYGSTSKTNETTILFEEKTFDVVQGINASLTLSLSGQISSSSSTKNGSGFSLILELKGSIVNVNGTLTNDAWCPIAQLDVFATGEVETQNAFVNFKVGPGVTVRGRLVRHGSTDIRLYTGTTGIKLTCAVPKQYVDNKAATTIIYQPNYRQIIDESKSLKEDLFSYKLSGVEDSEMYNVRIDGSAFSKYGGYIGDDKTDNLYFTNGSKALQTFVLTNKSQNFTSYNYLLPANASVGIKTCAKLGQTASYNGYLNCAHFSIESLSSSSRLSSQTLISELVDSGLQFTFNNNNLNAKPTKSYTDVSCQNVFGLYKVIQDDENELIVKWNEGVYEDCGGATQLYHCLIPDSSNTTPTMKCSNDIVSFAASSKSDKRALHIAKTLTTVNCTNATKLTAFEDFCFYECTNLNSITTTSNIINIGSNCFNGCSSLNSIILNNVTSIPVSAFYDCSSLATVNIKNAKSIGAYAFSNTTANNIQSIEFNQLESIGDYAFNNCSKLTTINITSTSDLTIGKFAFRNCKELTTVNINATGKITIDNQAFAQSKKMTMNINNCTTFTVSTTNAFPSTGAKGSNNTWTINFSDTTVRDTFTTTKVGTALNRNDHIQ